MCPHFEELDAPGEWFLNAKTHTLYFYPPAGLDLAKATVEATRLRSLVEFRGSEDRPMRFVTLRGLTFRHAARTVMDTKEPLLRTDWAIYRGGAVFFEGTEDCALEDGFLDRFGVQKPQLKALTRTPVLPSPKPTVVAPVAHDTTPLVWLGASVRKIAADGRITVGDEQPAFVLRDGTPTPRINSPKISGVGPGSPFLYSMAAKGDRPMTFAADGLPAGLQLDAATGHITSVLKMPGEFKVTLRATNQRQKQWEKP